jgi:hypothetical protein
MNNHAIDLKTFQHIIYLMSNSDDKLNKLNELDIDFGELFEPLYSIISHLIGSIYGCEGLDVFNWWCFDKEYGIRKDITMKSKNGKILCETIEELHQYLEYNKLNDYSISSYKEFNKQKINMLLKQSK